MHTTTDRLRVFSFAVAAAATLSCGRPSPASAPTALEPTPPPRLRVVATRWEEPRTVADAGPAPTYDCVRYPGGCSADIQRTAPAVASNGAGAGVVVWQRLVGGSLHMVSARFDRRRGWDPEQPIDTPAGSRLPLLAVDRQGRALAVWYANGAIYASQSPYDGGWTAPQALVEGFGPALVMDDAGRATLVASRSGVGVVALRANPRGEWSPADVLDDEAPLGAPTASLGADGAVSVLWSRGATASIWGYGREWSRTKTSTAQPGAPWSAETIVNEIEGGWAHSLHSTGGDTLSFRTASADDFGPYRNRLWAQRRTAAGWGALVDLYGGLGPRAAATTARLARLGADTLAVWIETNGARHWVRARTFSEAAGTWGEPVTVAERQGEAHAIVGLRVATSAAGNAVVVWGAYGAGNGLLASDFVPGTGWSTPRLLRTALGSAAEVAMDDAGNATVVWSELADPLAIRAARLLATTAPAP